MISISKTGKHISGSLLISVAFIIIVFACTKSKNNRTAITAVKYCGSINWSNTDGQSGTFTGSALNGSYALVYVEYKDNGTVGGFPLHYDSNDHLISDQPGVSYIYTQDTLTQITIQGRTGAGSYNFDTHGHFTNGVVNIVNGESSGTVTGIYSYDSNEDPTKFVASGNISTPNGPVNINIQINGYFLTDKTSLLPFIPVFAPATSYFSFIPFSSKHLLDKWVITISGTGIQTASYTAQYTYTYDNNGNVSTMVRSDNPNVTYTFVYSD